MMLSGKSSHIINEREPEAAQRQYMYENKPTQTAWLQLFKRIIKERNSRFAVLWLTAGVLFYTCLKPAIQRRERDLVVEDIQNYLEKEK